MRRRLGIALAVLVYVLGGLHGARAAEPDVSWKHYVMRSPASGKIERFWVGHREDLDTDVKHPVIYFLDGLLGHEHEWKRNLEPHLGRHEIIAVCPSVGGATWYMNSPAQPWMRWGDFLTEELRAFVEEEYPASREKGQRGIVGISAGAHGALYQALKRDLYGSVSALSPAIDLRGYMGGFGLGYWVGPRSNETLPLYKARSTPALIARRRQPLPFALFLDAGDSDGARGQMLALARMLTTKGETFKHHTGTGGHNWAYWRSRVADHLAWHAEHFERNAREGLYTEQPPAAPHNLEPTQPPDVTLSEAALARLAAPWDAPGDGGNVSVTGLPAEGAPLRKGEEEPAKLELAAQAGPRGHEPQVRSYRLELDVSTPLPSAGSVGLMVRLRNGQGRPVASGRVNLPIAEGEPKRHVPARARLLMEVLPPDSLRGGIVAGLQPFDADGRPAGEPKIVAAAPGTRRLEYWPIAPKGKLDLRVSVSEDGHVPLLGVHDVTLVLERPPANVN